MTRISPRGKRSIAVPTPNHDQTVAVEDYRSSMELLGSSTEEKEKRFACNVEKLT